MSPFFGVILATAFAVPLLPASARFPADANVPKAILPRQFCLCPVLIEYRDDGSKTASPGINILHWKISLRKFRQSISKQPGKTG
jgi:hypothetical protein